MTDQTLEQQNQYLSEAEMDLVGVLEGEFSTRLSGYSRFDEILAANQQEVADRQAEARRNQEQGIATQGVEFYVEKVPECIDRAVLSLAECVDSARQLFEEQVDAQYQEESEAESLKAEFEDETAQFLKAIAMDQKDFANYTSKLDELDILENPLEEQEKTPSPDGNEENETAGDEIHSKYVAMKNMAESFVINNLGGKNAVFFFIKNYLDAKKDPAGVIELVDAITVVLQGEQFNHHGGYSPAAGVEALLSDFVKFLDSGASAYECNKYAYKIADYMEKRHASADLARQSAGDFMAMTRALASVRDACESDEGTYQALVSLYSEHETAFESGDPGEMQAAMNDIRDKATEIIYGERVNSPEGFVTYVLDQLSHNSEAVLGPFEDHEAEVDSYSGLVQQYEDLCAQEFQLEQAVSELRKFDPGNIDRVIDPYKKCSD